MGLVVLFVWGGVGRGLFGLVQPKLGTVLRSVFPLPTPFGGGGGGGGGQIYTTLASSTLAVMGLVASAVLADCWATMGQV